MTAKIVCRLLTAANELLGWTQITAEARGDGKLWSVAPMQIAAERDGEVATLSLHWAEVNVETRVPFAVAVRAGTLVPVYDRACPVITVGAMPGPLPAVTVGSVAIGVPVGHMGARGR